MVRTPSCDKSGLKKGTWTPEEDQILIAYVTRYGCWNWRHIPRFAGLARCGKSCRLRWLNYLRPNIKRGNYTEEEEDIIIRLHEKLGNKWSIIATHLPGRTDNEIKNHWHTALKKRFGKDGVTNKNVKATKLNDSGPKHKQGMDSVQNNVSSPTTTSVLDANTEDVNKWTESYLTDICHSPIEIVPDIGNDNFQGSDITWTQEAWNLSSPSSSSEILVPEKDNFAFLETIESTTANFWTEPTPYVADTSHVPNELLIPLVNESDEYFSAMYDADLWSQNNSHDLHVSLFQ